MPELLVFLTVLIACFTAAWCALCWTHARTHNTDKQAENQRAWRAHYAAVHQAERLDTAEARAADRAAYQKAQAEKAESLSAFAEMAAQILPLFVAGQAADIPLANAKPEPEGPQEGDEAEAYNRASAARVAADYQRSADSLLPTAARFQNLRGGDEGTAPQPAHVN